MLWILKWAVIFLWTAIIAGILHKAIRVFVLHSSIYKYFFGTDGTSEGSEFTTPVLIMAVPISAICTVIAGLEFFTQPSYDRLQITSVSLVYVLFAIGIAINIAGDKTMPIYGKILLPLLGPILAFIGVGAALISIYLLVASAPAVILEGLLVPTKTTGGEPKLTSKEEDEKNGAQ